MRRMRAGFGLVGLLVALAVPEFSLAAPTRKLQIEGWSALLSGGFDRVGLDARGALVVAPPLVERARLPVANLWDAVPGPDGSWFAATGPSGEVWRIGAEGAVEQIFEAPGGLVRALAPAGDGSLWVAASNPGRLFRVRPGHRPELFANLGVDYVWCLLPVEGGLLAGTGPSGAVLRIPTEVGTGVATPETWAETGSRHVLALAKEASGSLLAGTGPEGRLVRITGQGKAFVLIETPGRELHRLLLRRDGSILAATYPGDGAGGGGSGPGGPGAGPMPVGGGGVGKPGSMAGTGNAMPVPLPEAGDLDGLLEGSAPVPVDPMNLPSPVPGAPIGKGTSTLPDASAPGGAPSAPAPVRAPAEPSGPASEILRVGTEGGSEVFWTRPGEKVHAMLEEADGTLLVGTGFQGRIFRVRDKDDWALVARTPDSDAVSGMVRDPAGKVLVLASQPGGLLELGSAPSGQGTFVARPQDAGELARWGRPAFRATLPPGTALDWSVRSGNTREPGTGWSDWSPWQGYEPGRDPGAAPCPSSRFVQMQVRLSAKGDATPQLYGMGLWFRSRNRGPTVSNVTLSSGASSPPAPVAAPPVPVPAPMPVVAPPPPSFENDPDFGFGVPPKVGGAGKGPGPKFPPPPCPVPGVAPPPVAAAPGVVATPGQVAGSALKVTWASSDPDGDTLLHTVRLAPEGSEEWIVLLHEDPDKKDFELPLDGLAQGWWVVEVTAIDRDGDTEAGELRATARSTPLLVDHGAPRIREISLSVSGRDATLIVEATDDHSPITSATWILDGSRERPLPAADGLLDARTEVLRLVLRDLSPGPHSLLLRVRDEAGQAAVFARRFAVGN